MKLIVPFLTDDPAFARGVEFGMLYDRMLHSQSEITGLYHVDNQEQITLLVNRDTWEFRTTEHHTGDLMKITHFSESVFGAQLAHMLEFEVPAEAGDAALFKLAQLCIEEMVLSVLRAEVNINSIKFSGICEADLHRMVAAVEESNASFESFVLRDFPGRPEKLIGYPVHYSQAVREGEAFGGMWSDGTLTVSPLVVEGNVGRFQASFVVRHGAAFVWIRSVGVTHGQSKKPEFSIWKEYVLSLVRTTTY